MFWKEQLHTSSYKLGGHTSGSQHISKKLIEPRIELWTFSVLD